MRNQAEIEQEHEANLFAMCLLIPEEFIRRDMAIIGPLNVDEDIRIKHLARRYNVSEQLMVNRLTNLGYLL
jgi:Zn-dependent peptidase ImmA (M78 family)